MNKWLERQGLIPVEAFNANTKGKPTKDEKLNLRTRFFLCKVGRKAESMPLLFLRSYFAALARWLLFLLWSLWAFLIENFYLSDFLFFEHILVRFRKLLISFLSLKVMNFFKSNEAYEIFFFLPADAKELNLWRKLFFSEDGSLR